ncbi:MAG: SPASM domain-containing protein [Thermoanaerobacteraceae bacterium]|nr:SPASM domain-containing protein [Thermoanaerobacteraceae bacterium]
MNPRPGVREEIEGASIIYWALPDLRRLYVEATNRCDAGCIMCVRRTWGEAEGDLTFELFQALMEEVPRFPRWEWLCFGGFGEPLLHHRLPDMVSLARRAGLRIKISTNGRYLSALAPELVRRGVEEVIVSCDSSREEGYASLRGGSLAQLEEGIRALNRAKERHGSPYPRLVVEFVAMRSNLEELKELPALTARWGAMALLVTNLLPYSEGLKEEILYSCAHVRQVRQAGGFSPEEPADIASTVWEAAAAKWFTWGTAKLPRMVWGASRHCRFIDSYSAVVTWEGDVVPCYALSHSYSCYVFGRRKEVKKYSFGNLRQQDLYAIWTSEEYVRFRGRVRLFRFPSCVDCELAYTCDYPAANEDCWGNSPSCADCLWAQDMIKCP